MDMMSISNIHEFAPSFRPPSHQQPLPPQVGILGLKVECIPDICTALSSEGAARRLLFKAGSRALGYSSLGCVMVSVLMGTKSVLEFIMEASSFLGLMLICWQRDNGAAGQLF